MSVPATEGVPTAGAGEEEGVDLFHGDGAFATLMDVLVAEDPQPTAGEAAGAGGAAASPAPAGSPGADGGGDGAAQPAAAGDAGAGAGAAAPAAGDKPGDAGAAAGGAEQPAAGAGAGDLPAAWTADAASLIPKLGELSVKLEENTTKAYQATALEAVREEHANYFAALEKHPRMLVGTQVPAIGKEGTETLRDTNDAREWQEAVKVLLTDEIRSRASSQMDESKDFLQTVHASIELFQNNADLVPGTKGFDVELANRFATMAEPYELRVDGKLQGYSIPVQPIINQLRTQVQKERAAQPATPAAPATVAAAAPAKAVDPPQAGIASKAGNSSEAEDFSALFGTIGLPSLQI